MPTLRRKITPNRAKVYSSNQLSLLDLFSGGSGSPISIHDTQPLFSPEAVALGGLIDVLTPAKSTVAGLPDHCFVPIQPPRTPAARINANITALKLLLGQTDYSISDKEALSRYSGWGGLISVFDKQTAQDNAQGKASAHNWATQYENYHEQLLTLLSEEQWEAAAASSLTAYYTPRPIVEAIWRALQGFGFSGGSVSELGAGTGNFIGYMPESLRAKTQVTAIEKDDISARILSVLYPEVETIATGLENYLQPGPVDLVIGNVPFGAQKVYDPNHRALCRFPIHNYFIGRGADMLKEGGLLAMLTTSGTLDAVGREFRRELAKEQGMCLMGAIRLPSCAFSDTGTGVTTDLLLMQKRGEATVVRNSGEIGFCPFVETLDVAIDSDIDSDTEGQEEETRLLTINEYYAERPAQMLGQMQFADQNGGAYRADSQGLYLKTPETLSALLSEAIANLPTQTPYKLSTGDVKAEGTKANAPIDPYANFGQIVKIKGKPYKAATILRAYDTLKLALTELLIAERTGSPDTYTDFLRENLRTEYRHFVAHFGRLTLNRAVNFIQDYDPRFAVVQGLELLDRNQQGEKRITEAPLLSRRVYPLSLVPEKIEAFTDAVAVSLYARGKIDPRFIAKKTGFTPEVVTFRLLSEGLVFEDPQTSTPTHRVFVDPASYLSGDVVTKLAKAKEAQDENPTLSRNVFALEAVQPARIPFALITAGLGATWIPDALISEYIIKTLGSEVRVFYSVAAGAYALSPDRLQTARSCALGTPDRDALQLIEGALNAKTILVTKTIIDAQGEERQVRDMEATTAAVTALEALQEGFTEFCTDFATELEEVFNNRFNRDIPKVYPLPAFPHYPGASPAISLRNHQFRAVERIKEGDTMLAHAVGSGKTFTMISAAMELKRLGKINKALIAVQNSTVADFGRAWQTLYPAAFILVPTKADLEASNRRRFLARLATTDYDGIVLPNSFLKLIADDPIEERIWVTAQIRQLEAAAHLSGARGKRAAKALEAKKAGVIGRTVRQMDRTKDDLPHFGELGIDYLALDECHTKKRLGFSTTRRSIKGIDPQGSQDAMQAMLKARTVQRKGGRVVLATGTPISNTMAEAWTMLRFIAADQLSEMLLGSFDQFASVFGKIIPSFELTATGQFKAIDRFAKFVNVKQLSDLYRQSVDVVLNDDVVEFKRDSTLPQLLNGEFTRVEIEQTEGVSEVLWAIRQELIDYQKMNGADKRENSHVPRVCYGKARKATTDIRLLHARNPDQEGSKANIAVANIARIYRESEAYNGTQLVFADTFQSPANGGGGNWYDEEGISPAQPVAVRFNLFADMRAKLIGAGVPQAEIAVVPDQSDKREAVFEKVRKGEVRILFGSSERMGVGVNVQNLIAAVHHLDAPNRPTDFEQRNGRAIRQGNKHAEWNMPIQIVTYGVLKTLDATAYGRMAMKQRFINQVLRGEGLEGEIDDVGGDDDFASMSFDQMMATLSGSKYALAYTAKKHALERLYNQLKNHNRGLIDAKSMVDRAEGTINRLTLNLPQYEIEAQMVATRFEEGKITSLGCGGVTHSEAIGAALELFCNELKLKARRGFEASTQITLNGLPFALKADIVDTDHNGRAIYGITYSWGLTLTQTVLTGIGMIHSVRAGIDHVTDAPGRARFTISRQQEVITEFGAKLLKPFAKVEQIKPLEAEVAELKINMEAETGL